MKEQEYLKLLDSIDEDMIEEAENYRGQKRGKGLYIKYALIAAGIILVFGVGFFSGRYGVSENNDAEQMSKYAMTEDNSEQADNLEDVHIELNESVTVTGALEESLIVYNPETKVIELNENKIAAYNLSLTHAVKHHWINMIDVFNEVDRLVELGELPDEEFYYLVELDISIPENPDIGTLSPDVISEVLGREITSVDELSDADIQKINKWHGVFYVPDAEVSKNEYERFTKECGYEFNWLPPGGYQIPDSYVYCLVYGRIYGLLTREQIINFAVNEEYGYCFRLAAESYFEMKEWEYKETYSEAELRISIWHSLR